MYPSPSFSSPFFSSFSSSPSQLTTHNNRPSPRPISSRNPVCSWTFCKSRSHPRLPVPIRAQNEIDVTRSFRPFLHHIHTTMPPNVDSAILEALGLEATSSKLVPHGGSGFSVSYKLVATKDGQELTFFVKIGTGLKAEVMFRGTLYSLPSSSISTL